MLNITMSATMPASTAQRGRQGWQGEGELLVIKDQRPNLATLVQVFDSGDYAENKDQATKLAGSINRRMSKVRPAESWHARAFPLAKADGTPDVHDSAPCGVWVTYTEPVNSDGTVNAPSTPKVVKVA